MNENASAYLKLFELNVKKMGVIAKVLDCGMKDDRVQLLGHAF